MGRAAVFPSRQRSVFAQAGTALVEALLAHVDAVSYARGMYREYLELSAMSDAALRTIGLRRADIPAVVTRTYRAGVRRMPPAETHFERAFAPQDRRRPPRRSARRSYERCDFRSM
jgi:uncharacterized protein YjiS (DUF1127 family)